MNNLKTFIALLVTAFALAFATAEATEVPTKPTMLLPGEGLLKAMHRNHCDDSRLLQVRSLNGIEPSQDYDLDIGMPILLPADCAAATSATPVAHSVTPQVSKTPTTKIPNAPSLSASAPSVARNAPVPPVVRQAEVPVQTKSVVPVTQPKSADAAGLVEVQKELQLQKQDYKDLQARAGRDIAEKDVQVYRLNRDLKAAQQEAAMWKKKAEGYRSQISWAPKASGFGGGMILVSFLWATWHFAYLKRFAVIVKKERKEWDGTSWITLSLLDVDVRRVCSLPGHQHEPINDEHVSRHVQKHREVESLLTSSEVRLSDRFSLLRLWRGVRYPQPIS